MKKYILYIVLTANLFMGGCNKWLDVPSKTEVIDYEMFETEQGFMDAMAGVYYLMAADELYGDMLSMTFLDMLARRYDVGTTISNISGLGEDLDGGQYYERQNVKMVVDEFWKKGYNVIANVNSLLEQIEEYKSVFTYDNYDMIKGEALGVRAFMHFDLMRMFAPSYQEAGDKDLLLPYVTQLSGRDWPLFSTKDEFIGYCLEDLEAAEQLLLSDDLYATSVENAWINNRRSHFNLWAVYATMARIYHWKGDKENALLYAKKVIEAKGQFKFFIPSTAASNTRDVAFYEECIFTLNKDNLEEVYKERFDEMTSNMLYNTEESIRKLYEESATDYRLEWLWYFIGDPDSSLECKFYRYNPSVADRPDLVTLIRLSEMYYIVAECCGNTQEGRDYLNTVRENRALQAFGSTISDEDFQKEILKEYKKEFYGEGQLFFYYKRLNQQMIENFDGTFVDMHNFGYVFPIPKEELDLRTNITNEES